MHYRLALKIGFVILSALPVLYLLPKFDFEKNKNNEPQDLADIDTNYGQSKCKHNGGKADDSGLRVWCWNAVSIPEYHGKQGIAFSEKELKIDSECYEKQVSIDGNRLKFQIDPTGPEVGEWCSRNFNMRAEIRTAPWHIRHPKGTEEWFGWSYTFDDDYKIDPEVPWLFFQVHPGSVGVSPHTELLVIKENQFEGHRAGEVYVVNAANGKDYEPTGIVPKAGTTLNIVVHAIWDDSTKGLLQVWIDDQKVYDKQVPTVYSQYPWGGNAKWGIYKWRWANRADVLKSRARGVTHLTTHMGPLRIITRKLGDNEYGKDSYALVAPR